MSFNSVYTSPLWVNIVDLWSPFPDATNCLQQHARTQGKKGDFSNCEEAGIWFCNLPKMIIRNRSGWHSWCEDVFKNFLIGSAIHTYAALPMVTCQNVIYIYYTHVASIQLLGISHFEEKSTLLLTFSTHWLGSEKWQRSQFAQRWGNLGHNCWRWTCHFRCQ